MSGLGLMGLGLTVVRSKLILSDSFNRANGAIGSAETGQAYTQHTGVWTVSSNQATNDATSNALVSAQCSVPDAVGAVDIVHASAQSFLVFRLVDASNFLLVGFQSSSNVLVYFQNVATVFTEINVPGEVTVSPVRPGRLTVEARGNTVKAYWNGVLVRTETISQFNTATRWGLFGGNVTAPVFDNLAVAP